jgi:hypothetical protein
MNLRKDQELNRQMKIDLKNLQPTFLVLISYIGFFRSYAPEISGTCRRQ